MRVNTFNSQAPVRNFSFLSEEREALPPSFSFSHFCLLVTTELTSDDGSDGSLLSKPVEEDDEFLCLRGLFRLRSRDLSFCLVLSVESLRIIRSFGKFETGGEAGGEVREDATFYPILFPMCVSF